MTMISTCSAGNVCSSSAAMQRRSRSGRPHVGTTTDTVMLIAQQLGKFHSRNGVCKDPLVFFGEETMERIEKSIEVRCPVHAAYNQWTQFEDFPRFMSGVK